MTCLLRSRAAAAGQRDVRAVALVGSWARGTARADSDVDVVLLAESPARYVQSGEWLSAFGAVRVIRTRRWASSPSAGWLGRVALRSTSALRRRCGPRHSRSTRARRRSRATGSSCCTTLTGCSRAFAKPFARATGLLVVLPGCSDTLAQSSNSWVTGSPRTGHQPSNCRQSRSNRSRFMTLSHAATKSCTNLSAASSEP